MSMARQSMSLRSDCSVYTANSFLTALSFPLVGNPSASEKRFWIHPPEVDKSQNDRINDFKEPLRSLRINNIRG
jgi:hypothetical protein